MANGVELLREQLQADWDAMQRFYRRAGSPHSLVLQYGRPYYNQRPPKGLRQKCAKKACFYNAARLVLQSEDRRLGRFPGLDVARYEGTLIYVEGFALSVSG